MSESADRGSGSQGRRACRRREARTESEAGSVILSEEEVHEERDDGAPIEILEQYFEAQQPEDLLAPLRLGFARRLEAKLRYEPSG